MTSPAPEPPATVPVIAAPATAAAPAVRDFDLLWDYNDPAGTEAKFRQRLAELKRRADVEPAYELELLTQIARCEGLQQNFDAAHATLDGVERRLAEDKQLPLTVRVRYLLERGRTFNSSQQPERARPLFVAATSLAMGARLDFYAVDAMHMLGIVETDPKAQLDWNFQAMKLAEASADERARGWLGSLYNNIGWSYYASNRYDDALDVFRKAVTLREQAGRPGPLRIAHYSVGKTLRAMGKLDEALAIQRRLHDEASKSNEPDGFICEEIAECLLAQGKSEEAKPYVSRAYELLSTDEWLKRDEPARLERLRQLSQ